MKTKNEVVILAAISSSLLIGLIMMFSYIQIKTSNSDPIPFGMSRKHIEFQQRTGGPVSFQNLVDPLLDTEVFLVSYNDGDSYIGVYDPALVNAYENAFHGFGMTRYFDQSDYISGSKSGIIVQDKLSLSSFSEEMAMILQQVSDQVDEILYMVDSQSSFNFNGQIKEVVNLASLPALGNWVYLDHTDYEDQTTVHRISERLIQSGYQIVEKQPVGLFQALLRSQETIFGAIMMSGAVFYVLFAGICFWHFFDFEKEQRVHFLHGGTLPSMFAVIGKPFLFTNALGLLPAYLFCIYQRQSGYLIITPRSVASLFGLHLLITSLCYFMAFLLSFRMVQKTKGVRDYAV